MRDEDEINKENKKIQVVLQKERQIIDSYWLNFYIGINKREIVIYLNEAKKILSDWNNNKNR